MPRQAFWKGDDLYRLLTLKTNELCDLYPQYNSATIKGKKAYWRNKLNRGEIEMPPKPKPENSPESNNFGEILKLHNLSSELAKEFTEQGFHIGYIKNAEGEIEYTIPLPNAKGKGSHMDDFTPATPAIITPTKRKPEKRDHKLLYVFSDAQVDYRRLEDGSLEPIHDESALEAGRLLCKDLKPDEIINCGDTVDLAALSRFDRDSDHFHRTLGPSFQRVHDYYAQLRADSPWAKITEVDSNHNTRIKKFILKSAPSLYGTKRPGEDDSEYPMFTYPFLTNLNKLDVNWVSGYGAAEYVYGLEYDTPPIIFKHGTTAVSNGSTAAKESKENPEVNVVRGHSHRMESHYRTTRSGNYLASIVVGVACKTTGEVPSYYSAVDDHNEVVNTQENWQQGALVIEDYDGHYNFHHVPILRGVAHYAGKRYDGNDR